MALIYLDDSGKRQTIVYQHCYDNYFAKWTHPDFWEQFKNWNQLTDDDYDEHLERLKERREIAMRDITQLYIEFHTQPPVSFEFATLDDYYNVLRPISEIGWMTFDLS